MTNNTTNSSTEEFWITFRKYWFIFVVIRTVVDFVIFVINLATIVIFVINRHLLRRSAYCLINLAVADMLYGLFRMIWIIMFLSQYYGLMRTFVSVAADLLLFASLLSLVVVSLDRVYATFFPFRHRTTRLRMYIAVFTITWLLPLPSVIMFQLRTVRNIFTFLLAIDLILYLICLVIICISYTAIFVQIKIQAKRIQPNQQQTAAVQSRQKREQHLAMTLFIVTVLSLITWLPSIICFFLFFFSLQNSYILYYVDLSFLLRDTNSLINPIVYVFRMRDFRKALKKLIFKCSRDQHHTHPIGHHGRNHDRQQQPPIELQVM